MLYGSAERWREIARLNGLKSPDGLRVGQRLRLPEKPLRTGEEARRFLGEFWLKKSGVPSAQLPKVTQQQRAPEIEVRTSGSRAEIVVPVEAVAASPVVSDPEVRSELAAQARTPVEQATLSGRALLEAGRTAEALEVFQSERTRDPDFLPSWFLELRCLRVLGREKELQQTLAALLARFPRLESLPVVMQYRRQP